jgi:peptide/nickel transport system substrate-binding protein
MRSFLKVAGLAGFALFAGLSGALAQKSSNTIRFAYDQVPENIDPFFNNVRIGVIIGQHVWDTLIYRDPVSGEYKGQLATAWKWVDDKTLSSTPSISSRSPRTRSSRKTTWTGSRAPRSSTPTRSASN